MKPFNLLIGVFATILISGCGFSNYLTHNQNQNSTTVILSENNFSIVRTVEARISTNYIFGIGGMGKRALYSNVMSALTRKANLSGSQALINISTKLHIDGFLIWERYTVEACGTVIEFHEKGGQSVQRNKMPRQNVQQPAKEAATIVANQVVETRPKEGYEDLSKDGTANCYIVSDSGYYRFKSTKGNRSTSVGSIASAEVLWESFGTSTVPSVGDLIETAVYSDGYIYFSTPGTFREGNAVIAAKDSNGKILWSWHIWMTDKPEDQVYNNNAGTMMDRNLGAISATPGDVGALGLLYQWGRKDPFLGSSSISSSTKAKSTINWPSAVSSNSSYGTITYATEHPTTFITDNGSNGDWYYTGDFSTDNTRWQSSKTIYDPCPSGYRVPDGGSNGIWSKAFGTSSSFDQNAYDSTNEGFNFGSSVSTRKLTSSSSTCWYPAAGYLYYGDGSLYNVGRSGTYWSCSPDSYNAYYLYFNSNGNVYPSNSNYRATGQSVRCLREE